MSAKRKVLLQAIHAQARSIGLITKEDRSAYEDVLYTLTAKKSCSEMDDHQLSEVLSHLKGRSNTGSFRSVRRGTQLALLCWIWSRMAHADVVTIGDKSLLAWAVSELQHPFSALEFIPQEDVRTLVERLKKWAQRTGVKWAEKNPQKSATRQR